MIELARWQIADCFQNELDGAREGPKLTAGNLLSRHAISSRESNFPVVLDRLILCFDLFYADPGLHGYLLRPMQRTFEEIR